MERLIRTIPYENDTDSFPQIPEFKRAMPTKVVYVRERIYAVGDSSRSYASMGFTVCSGFVFKDKKGINFGLFHAVPMQDLYPNDFKNLKTLAGGQVILIEGSASIPSPRILSDLEQKLGIKHTGTIRVDTRRPQVGNMHFHVAFRPKTDEILVARNSHKDLLIYSGFKLLF